MHHTQFSASREFLFFASSPRSVFLLGEDGKWGSAGGSSLSVSEDRFQSERNNVRSRTKLRSRRLFFFFFFPTFESFPLSGVAISFFFFSGISLEPFYSRFDEDKIFPLSFFFPPRSDVSEHFVNF